MGVWGCTWSLNAGTVGVFAWIFVIGGLGTLAFCCVKSVGTPASAVVCMIEHACDCSLMHMPLCFIAG